MGALDRALANMLAIDKKRQDEGRNPTTSEEVLASDTIAAIFTFEHKEAL